MLKETTTNKIATTSKTYVHFRDIFMRTILPTEVYRNESSIVNLNNAKILIG